MNKIKIILFNIFETLFILFIGYVLVNLDMIQIAIISLLFFIPRMLFGGASHYKSPFKCFVVSSLLTTTIFLMYKVNPLLGYTSAVFSGSILSEKGDIQNLYQWKCDTDSVHKILIDYIKFNGITNEYLETEKLLKERITPKDFLIYKRRFINGCTYEEISSEFNIVNPRIKESLDKSYYYIIGRLNL